MSSLLHGAELLSNLNYKLYCVMGEHDYCLDLGEYWSKLYGPQYYRWDYKGVHFVVLNSILTYDDWTFNKWPSAAQRMLEMAGLDDPKMIAIEAYTAHDRRGVALAPGKH